MGRGHHPLTVGTWEGGADLEERECAWNACAEGVFCCCLFVLFYFFTTQKGERGGGWGRGVGTRGEERT